MYKLFGIIFFFQFSFIKSMINLNEIYPKRIINLNIIKIIHKTNNSEDKPLCVFGVLENNYGLKIEEEILKWLLPDYNVYIVYQKYPGKLFEYPALRFAQWLIKKKMILFYYIFILKGLHILIEVEIFK